MRGRTPVGATTVPPRRPAGGAQQRTSSARPGPARRPQRTRSACSSCSRWASHCRGASMARDSTGPMSLPECSHNTNMHNRNPRNGSIRQRRVRRSVRHRQWLRAVRDHQQRALARCCRCCRSWDRSIAHSLVGLASCCHHRCTRRRLLRGRRPRCCRGRCHRQCPRRPRRFLLGGAPRCHSRDRLKSIPAPPVLLAGARHGAKTVRAPYGRQLVDTISLQCRSWGSFEM